MSYQVLYRQLRPKTFSEMLGQETVVQTLKNQVMAQKIPHAYLFCGSRGTGKTSAAKILAKAVNCLEPNAGDPCGKCKNCIELSAETSLDIVEMDAASNNGVDEIRDLREQVKYPPQVGKYKVYIIDEAHMLTMAAFNALLKTLEEPPEHALFILATTEPQKLPATIISRCQRFEFKRIPAHQMAQRLKEVLDEREIPSTPKGLQLIARSAEGGLRDAFSILDMCLGTGGEVDEKLVQQVLGTADTSFLFTFAQKVIDKKTNEALNLLDQLLREGKEAQVFAKDVAYHFRALLLAKTAEKEIGDILEITTEDAQDYVKQAKPVTTEELLYITDTYMEIESQLRYATSGRILLETATIKGCLASKIRFSATYEKRLKDLENLFEQLENKVSSGQFAVADVSKINAGSADMKKVEKDEFADDSDSQLSHGFSTDGQKVTADAKNYVSQQAPSAKKEVAAEQKTVTHQTKAGDTQEIWKQTMKLLQKNQAGIYGQLREGKFTGISSDVCTVTFDKSNVFMVNYLNQESRKNAIMDYLKEVSGKAIGFEAVVQSEKKETAKTQASMLENLFNDFGRENIQIDEE